MDRTIRRPGAVRTTPRGDLLFPCLAIALLLAGCATPRGIWGGLGASKPRVTLVSVTGIEGAYAEAYPLVPIPLPTYPWDFSRAGIVGEATVRVVIDSAGKVSQATVIATSHRELGEEVLLAVERWRFRRISGSSGSQPASVVLDCRFKFDFED